MTRKIQKPLTRAMPPASGTRVWSHRPDGPINWKIRQRANAGEFYSARIDMDFSKQPEFYFLLRSDVHHDSPYCDRRMETRHLHMARALGAGIIDNGDMFDSMQAPHDPRRVPDLGKREEHKGFGYFNKLSKSAVSDYLRFAPWWAIFAEGNHETAMEKHHGLALTRDVVENMRLRAKQTTQVVYQGYAGWVLFSCVVAGSRKTTFRMFRHHGWGGGAPVTQGIIKKARMLKWLERADIILIGHSHQEWYAADTRLSVSDHGVPRSRKVRIYKVPGYKSDFDLQGGFPIERMSDGGPTTQGAVLIRFYKQTDEDGQPRFKHDGMHID